YPGYIIIPNNETSRLTTNPELILPVLDFAILLEKNKFAKEKLFLKICLQYL
ncbi:conserved hypothetical protein, partial [Listeria innocua FSL S4-378]